MHTENIKDTSDFTVRGKGFIKSFLIAIGFTMIVFAIFAILLTFTGVSQTLIPAVVLITSIVSVILAGVTSAKYAKSKGYQSGAVTGILYVLLLYITSCFMNDGLYFNAYMGALFAIGLFAGAFGGILGINFNNKRK